TPSNKLYMPYLENYTKVLDQNNKKYDIVMWDRFQLQEQEKYVYRDKKTGHQRKVYDYLKYTRFVKKILKEDKYDQVIIFGLQLYFFLYKYLNKYYKNNYILDIRDYNKSIKLF